MQSTLRQLTEGLWRWTARHPEWHPGEFGSEVVSFALRAGDETILIDPLLPPDASPVLDLIEREHGERLAILITIPYHVRSSQELRDRFRGQVETTIWGHPACRKRLADGDGFQAFAPGDLLPGVVSAHRIGKPRRDETPLLALAAYNAGAGAVEGCMCVPPYPETQAYVARILGLLGGAGDIAVADTLEVRLVS